MGCSVDAQLVHVFDALLCCPVDALVTCFPDRSFMPWWADFEHWFCIQLLPGYCLLPQCMCETSFADQCDLACMVSCGFMHCDLSFVAPMYVSVDMMHMMFDIGGVILWSLCMLLLQ